MELPEIKSTEKGAIVYIFNSRGCLLLFKRDDEPYEGWWEVPGGKIEKNESTQQAAVREVFEETRIEIKEKDLKPVSVFKSIYSDAVLIAFAIRLDDITTKRKRHEYGWFKIKELPPKTLHGPHEEVYNKFFGKKK